MQHKPVGASVCAQQVRPRRTRGVCRAQHDPSVAARWRISLFSRAYRRPALKAAARALKKSVRVHLERITAHHASRDLRREHRAALEAAHPHLVGGGARGALRLQVQRFDAVARKNAASEIARGLPAHRHPAPHLRCPRGRRRRATAGRNRAKRALQTRDSVAMR